MRQDGPQYQRAADELRRRLRGPELPVGHRFNGIATIVELTGVSHGVAWHALQVLADDKEVEVRRGTGGGTVVLPAPAETTALREIGAALRELDEVRDRLVRAARLVGQVAPNHDHREDNVS